MSYEINEVVIIDEHRHIVNAGVGTFTKVHPAELEVGTGSLVITDLLNETDLSSDSQSALPTQHSVKAYVDSAISSVQSDVDANELASDSAESALSGRLDTLESDPTTQSLLDAEATARTNADSALSGRLDTLEADPTTATALAAVQADVDANETASDNAESALSGRLDTLEADPTTQTLLDNEVSTRLAADVVLNSLVVNANLAIAANEVHIDKAATLSGVAKDSEDLGTFTGSTISDSSTIKAALQDLENGVDNALGGGAAATSVETVTTATDATHYLTFVNADNSTGTQENVFTDAGIQYNPSSNILTAGEIVVTGDLTVNGSQTVINTTTITTEDKNITLGNTSSPTDATADGGGFTLKGATDKTFNWIASTGSFTASEHIDLASGKQFLINNVGVLNATTLGAGVVNSSLTSVGTLTDLTVDGITSLNSAVFLGDASTDAIAVVGGIASDLEPLVTNAVDLGVSARKWKDLYLDGIVSIDDTNVLSVDTLGSGVLNSSLTSVGSLTDLTVTGDITANGNITGDGATNITGINVMHSEFITIANINLNASATELNYLDGSTPGTATASNAVVLDASLDIAGINNIDIAGDLVGDGASNISGVSSVTASGKMFAQAFTVSSDADLKENIAEIPNAVEKVEAIRGVTFDWKDGSGSTAGIIAQEVEAIMPMLIDNGEHKRVDYNGLVGLLVEAVKELSAEVKALKANN